MQIVDLDLLFQGVECRTLYSRAILEVELNVNKCYHWACNKSNTCVGCGAIICSICLKEQVECKCENTDVCCKS